MKLKQTPPQDAKKRYLKEKKTHVANKTLYNYTTALDLFTDWLTDNGYDDLRDVDSDVIDQFKEWRLSNVKPITARNDMRTIKNFIEFCESLQAVPVGLNELIRIPKVKESDEISDEILHREEVKAILEHLGKFDYAHTRHVVLLLLWKCGMRIGGLRALDVDDFDEGRTAIEIRHRPESRTPLKRKENSERDVIISADNAEVIADYIENERPTVEDDYGREPLIATQYGRAARTTITRHVYAATKPCFYNGGSCPFEKNPETCEATEWNKASQCPGSVSPHALRRGYVTAARNAGQSKEVTGERVNMSGNILDKHYDHGTESEKAERRRDHLKDI